MKHISEIKPSEEESLIKIKALEHQIHLLTFNSEESFILVDKSLAVIAFNRQFFILYLKYFGKEVKNGISVLELAMPERREMLRGVYERTFSGEKTETEFDILLPDNDTITIRNRFKPSLDVHGNIVGAYVTSEDITLLKKIEQERNQALKKIEIDNRNFKALIDNSSDMIWSVDKFFRIIACNRTFEDYVFNSTGHKVNLEDDVLGYFLDDQRKEKFQKYCLKTQTGESKTIVDHYFQPDEIWREVSFNPIYDESLGIYNGVVCISRDITERKRDEKKLKLGKIRLKQAQKLARIGNWSFDKSSGILQLSDEACKIFGIKPALQNNTLQTLFEHVHQDDKVRVLQSLEKANELKQDIQLYCRLLHSGSKPIHIYMECIFEKGTSVRNNGMFGIVQDVTERVQKENEMQKLLLVTQKQNDWLNSFTHIVSHNIRSNNNNIKSLTELLDECGDIEERIQLMNMLRTSTNKLDETIHNLSEFLKFQNLENRTFVQLNVKEEINKTLSAVNQTLTETGAIIQNNVSDEIGIPAVPSFLESILLNLLTNAIKYRSDDKKLILKFDCYKNDTYAVLCVEDNGIGIDLNKHKDSVFGLFKTFHNNKDAVGFGLFMTKNQMELMNGKIEIQSEPGKGTILKLYFNEKN